MCSALHCIEILKWSCMNGYQIWNSAIHQANYYEESHKKEHIYKQNISENLFSNEK